MFARGLGLMFELVAVTGVYALRMICEILLIVGLIWYVLTVCSWINFLVWCVNCLCCMWSWCFVVR